VFRTATAGAAVTVGLASATLAIGCANSEDATSSAPLALTGRPIVPVREVALRVAAEEVVTGLCMERAGFRYPRATQAEIVDEQRRSVAQPYGFRTAAAAQQAVTRREELRREAPSIALKDRYKATLTAPELARYQRAYYGRVDQAGLATIALPEGRAITVAIGGCRGVALRRLYGDPVEWLRLDGSVDVVRALIVHATVSSPAVRRALRSWRRCARSKGIRSANPFVAAFHAARLPAEQRVGRAGAIWKCQVRASLVDVGLATERKLAAPITEQHRHDLKEYQARSQRAAQTAAQIVTAGR